MAKKTEKVESTGNNKVQAALALLNKTFGEGSAMTFNSTEVKKIPAISTGSISLDLALGIGGLPLGRCCEIFGPESSGKSTICLQVCAEAQKQGYTVAYFDLENAFDPLYAKNLGVDLNNLIFSQPSSMEDAFNAMKVLLENKLCNVIIFDSIASGRTKAELAENFEVGDNLIGLQARLMSQGLRSIAPLANEANCLCLFTNQIRQKIGVMFGSPEVTSGGNAMAFYSSVRMRISGKTQIKEGKGDDAIATARETEVKIVKNKVAPPFRTANFVIRFGKGISKEEEVLDYAIKFGLIEKAGAWFKYKGENVAQGKEKALVWLKSNPELLDEFTTKVKEFVMSSFENTEEDEDLALQDNEDNIKYNPETGEILEEGDK